MINLTDLVQEAGKLKDEIEEKQKRLEMLKNNIKNIHAGMLSAKKKPEMSSIDYVCSIAKSLSIEYDYDKMKAALDKETFKQIVSKEYSLQDVPDFLKLLREYGVPVEEVKKHIVSYSYIDKDKVQEAFDDDLFTLSDIAGAYTSTLKRVVRITKK